MSPPTEAPTACCIVGGGPAGMMLGYLLARAGVPVTVLEKHADFLRDFRGDTVHPSTLRVLDELGLLDAFLQRPHQRLHALDAWFGDEHLRLADFSGLPPRHGFVAMMPQWDFLDFLAAEAARLPCFTLRRRARVEGLLIDAAGVVRGVTGMEQADGGQADPAGERPFRPFQLQADCTIGCDGRHSTVRAAAGLVPEDVGAPIDVLWFRVGRDPADTDSSLARIQPGRFLVTIDRGSYWQCAFVVPKGSAAALQQQPIAHFRAQVQQAAPFLAPRLADIAGWQDVKLLTVVIDRLPRWSRAGLLCIGDAAHAMSPVGGVGINLAIQDAVATANLLAARLRDGVANEEALDAVRQRRLWPTRVTQAMQVALQDNVLVPALGAAGADGAAHPLHLPLPMRLVSRVPTLQRLLARGLGMGVRPEHVRLPV